MTFSKLSTLITTTMLSLFILSGCSVTSESPAKNKADDSITIEAIDSKGSDIKSIGQDMIKMGVIPKETPKEISEKTANKSNKQNTANTALMSTQYFPLDKTPYQQFLAQQILMKSTLAADTKARYQLALTKMKNQHWQQAKLLLNEVIEQSPELSGAHLNKALAQYHLKQFNSAIQSLNDAGKVNALSPYSYNLQGVLAREVGKFSQAEKYYQKALTIWPDYPQAHLNLAVLFELYRGEFSKAKTHYQAYLLLEPNDKKTKLWLAGLEIKIALRKGS
jgi:tetratricopeptide (TPR) repeat protein